MRIIRFDTLDSTNSEASRQSGQLEHGDVILTHSQTAGRGQRGNTWESEPGKNLTFSIFLRPDGIEPARTFWLSMAISVAMVEALREIINTDKIKIKWPNDIYFEDLKLAGILIENTFTGKSVSQTIAGIGLNVNQTCFVSDAPNPVSMALIAGRTFDLESTLHKIVSGILSGIDSASDGRMDADKVVNIYHKLLWRGEGTYLWRKASKLPGSVGSDEKVFEASIVKVSEQGPITLRKTDGEEKTYSFKEIFPVF